MIVEASDIEDAAVVPECRSRCRIPREVPRSGGAAELITQAADPVGPPLLLPHNAIVVTGSGRARCVIDELFEVVGVGVSTLFECHWCAAIRIAVNSRVIARQRILTSEGQLAQLLAFEADPRVAVGQDPRRVHLTGIENEFALQLEDDIRKRGSKSMPAGDSPAVAAEPRDLVTGLATAFGVGIADSAQRDVEETVQGDAIGRSHLERDAGAYVIRRGDEPLRCGLRGAAGPHIRKRFPEGSPLLISSLL